MNKTSILVADGSHARLFSSVDPALPWSLVQKDEREHSRERTNRPESHEDRGEHGFARQLVGQLETMRQEGKLERLVLVAPPKFLGQLRAELPAPLAALVARSVDADYTHVSDTELPEHVDIA